MPRKRVPSRDAVENGIAQEAGTYQIKNLRVTMMVRMTMMDKSSDEIEREGADT